MTGSRRTPLKGFDDPDKPVSEMTPEELAAFRRNLRHAIRDDQIRRGRATPRTQREMRIWLDAGAPVRGRRRRRS